MSDTPTPTSAPEVVTGTPTIDGQQFDASDSLPPIDMFLDQMNAAAKEPATEDDDDGTEESDGEQEGSEESSAEEAGSEEAEEEVELAPAKKVPTKPRTFKVKLDGKDVDLPDSIELVHKVDGKPVKVTLAEVLNRYSGEVSIEKQFSDFRTQQKAFETEKQQFASEREELGVEKEALNSLVSGVLDFTKERNPGKLIAAFGEIAGLDPIDFEISLLESIGPFAEKWAQKSAAEKEALVNSRRLAVLKKQNADKEKKSSAEKEQQKFIAHLADLCTQHSISHEEFAERATELREMVQDGQLPGVTEITPQLVVSYTKNLAQQKRVLGAIAKVNPTLASNEATVRDLIGVAQNHPDLSDEDLMDIVRDAYGAAAAEESELEKKLNKRLGTNGQPAKPSKQNSKPKVMSLQRRDPARRDIVTLDDL